ncbi:MAG: YihY/virulence factor BrkB family protein [Oxalobacteraceae bacterium]|uniref:YihY/virulence factor BrkB family protein n=1 Tax=unclassified Methylobacterium TaxID=2615210 RepID=UPI0010CEAA0E|nr:MULTISPECIES: YihY/virulence factor BrkB family protein [unclassified Methylobacterium]MCJ2005851.1 YihY/virulence factor BrkB family protein [Methylobacterium sp. J-092]RYF21428.1 MAG: YihY/virulence factor BrkB family protein [Oxalobacteraceae bacterium]TXM93766.1 YihY/virulence factor BrkB family protein [Methylobacterium sp. WL116]
MTDPIQQLTPQPRTETSPIVWTLFLGTALLGLVALPHRRLSSRPEGASSQLGAEEGPRTHEGAAASQVADTEVDRGRKASTPSEIPAKGWLDIGKRLFQEFGNDRVLLVAAGVTFYAILALFPAIGAFVSIYGLVADPTTINEQLASLQSVMPGGALDIIGEQVKRIAAKGGGTLGFTAAFGIVVSIWSANGGMKAIFDALNIVYDEKEKRNFFWLNLRSLTFTAGALLFVVLALVGIVVIPAALALLNLGSMEWVIALARWPILLLVVLGSLALLYRYGPSREAAKWRWVTWGSGVAGVLWIVVSALFSWYVSSFGNYNETYGSLGAIIGFMTWIWISTTIVLLGAELNAEMEHQTVTDTTTGRPEELGARKAKVADTVAASA